MFLLREESEESDESEDVQANFFGIIGILGFFGFLQMQSKICYNDQILPCTKKQRSRGFSLWFQPHSCLRFFCSRHPLKSNRRTRPFFLSTIRLRTAIHREVRDVR